MDLFQESYYLSGNNEQNDDYYGEASVIQAAGSVLLGSVLGVILGELEIGLLNKLGTWSAKKVKNNLGRAIQEVFEIISDRDNIADNIKELRRAINKISSEANRIGTKLRNNVFTDKECEAIYDLAVSCSEISLFIRNKRMLKKDQARFGDRLKDFIEYATKCLEIVKDKPNEA